MRIATTLRAHWPEYLIEAWALGLFMLSAAAVTLVLEHPSSAVRAAIADPTARRLLVGVAMGLTAVALIYSPWGKRSGAHMNPAVTLSFWRLGKITGIDAAGYMLAQFAGGTAAVIAVAWLAGEAFTAPPVAWVGTVPGTAGPWVAFAAEVGISFGLMLTVLLFSNRARLASYTGLAAGVLVALYIGFEAPYSGMSMNPARSFASAAPAGAWSPLWIYFLAPTLGMLAAAECYVRAFDRGAVHCAKLVHADDQRCIHCGHEPPARAGTRRPIGANGVQS